MKISPKVTELSPKVINNKTIKKSNKMKLNIAVLAGDGIGPEIMKQGVAVMQAIAEKFNHEFTYNEASAALTLSTR